MSNKTVLTLVGLAAVLFFCIFVGMRSDYKTISIPLEAEASTNSIATRPASDFIQPIVNVNWSGDSYKGGKIIILVSGEKEQEWLFTDSSGNHKFFLSPNSLTKGFKVVLKYYAFGKWHKMKPDFGPYPKDTDKVNLRWTSDLMGLPVLQSEYEIPIPDGK